LIVKFAATEATDRRDNVYALLGISSDASDRNIFPPGYEKRFPDLLQDIARFLVFGNISRGIKYKVPAATLTDVIEVLGRLRRDAAQWAFGNIETQKIERFLKVARLQTEGKSDLGVMIHNSGPRDIAWGLRDIRTGCYIGAFFQQVPFRLRYTLDTSPRVVAGVPSLEQPWQRFLAHPS
jgi:hypothetical protein